MEFNTNKLNVNDITGGGRNYSIDLLKIISMMMVVILHLNLFGGLNHSARLSDDFTFKFVVNFYEEICIIAVNVFVIISSWFLSSSSTYNLKSKRVVCLVVSMYYWYILMTLFAITILDVKPGIKGLLSSIPIVGSSYDFISGYLVMYFSSPFLNRLTNTISTKSYRLLAVGLFITFCLFAPITFNGYLAVGGGYNFVWFLTIYIIVGYIRTRGVWSKYSWKSYLSLFLILTIVGTLFRCLLPKILYVSKGYYNDPVIFLSALTCFLLFASFTIKREFTKKIIKFFVPLSVAVFFIHANPFIEEWFRTVGFSSYINNRTLLYALVIPAITISVFIVCTLLDYLRNVLFEKIRLNKVIDNVSSYIDKYLIYS